jgi:hypothetical protein
MMHCGFMMMMFCAMSHDASARQLWRWLLTFTVKNIMTGTMPKCRVRAVTCFMVANGSLCSLYACGHKIS